MIVEKGKIICLDCKSSRDLIFTTYPECNEETLELTLTFICKQHNGHRIKIEMEKTE